jgi:hypothetical protein
MYFPAWTSTDLKLCRFLKLFAIDRSAPSFVKRTAGARTDEGIDEMTMKISLLAAVMIGFGASAACAQGHSEYQDPIGSHSTHTNPTAILGMHACDGPHLMSGVHLANNFLLCSGVTGAVNGDVFRFIDEATESTVDGVSQVRTCGLIRDGRATSAMKGIYDSTLGAGTIAPIMICSQVPNLGPVHIDHNTQRHGMHACPLGEIMVGIKIASNMLACALPPP